MDLQINSSTYTSFGPTLDAYSDLTLAHLSRGFEGKGNPSRCALREFLQMIIQFS